MGYGYRSDPPNGYLPIKSLHQPIFSGVQIILRVILHNDLVYTYSTACPTANMDPFGSGYPQVKYRPESV